MSSPRVRYDEVIRGAYQRIDASSTPPPLSHNLTSSSNRWQRLPVWWLAFMMLARLVLFVVIVQGLLMQQRDVGTLWPRDKFFWAIVASLVMELPLHIICQRATTHNPDGRRITAARLPGQIIAHLFTFVAFFRTDTALFARSESAYGGTLMILAIDAMMFREMKMILEMP